MILHLGHWNSQDYVWRMSSKSRPQVIKIKVRGITTLDVIYLTEILSFFNTIHKHIVKYIPSWHNTNSISAEIRMLYFQPFINSHFLLYIIVELVTSQELPQQNVRKWCTYFENYWIDIHDGYSYQPSMLRTIVNAAHEWMNEWYLDLSPSGPDALRP